MLQQLHRSVYANPPTSPTSPQSFLLLSSALVVSSGRIRIYYVYFPLNKENPANPSFGRSETDPRSVQSARCPMHKQSPACWLLDVLPEASAAREGYLENRSSQTNTAASYTARALSPFPKSRRTSSHNWQSACELLLNIQVFFCFYDSVHVLIYNAYNIHGRRPHATRRPRSRSTGVNAGNDDETR